MRDRSLLHYTKLNEFLTWASTKNYEILETKGEHEVFRLKKGKDLISGYKQSRTDHITVYDKGLVLVKTFLRSTK